MKFKHLTDDQINLERNILSPGICKWQCIQEENKHSKAGNEMKVLTLKLWDTHGKEGLRKVYLVDLPSMHWKLKNFFISVGHPEQYEKDEIPDGWCLFKEGYGILTMRKASIGDDGKMYQATTEVGDFLAKDDPRIGIIASTGAGINLDQKLEFNDDIPF